MMKSIGLLGGTSWPSTISYYSLLNKGISERLGGFHSARILLYSMDYHPIKSLYQSGWDKIPALLQREIETLLEMGPDCLIICNNTLHRAFDVIQAEMKIAIPVFHAGHLVAEAALKRGDKTVLLLATAFTMEDGFFARYLEDRGIKVIIPNAEDRKAIQNIQSQVAAGVERPEFRSILADLLQRYKDVDSIAVACTELPLVLDERNAPLPLIDAVKCQCDAALAFVCG